MSLIRQIVILLGAVIVLALAGAVSLNVVAARETLQAQLRVKNADNATALALALSQHRGDATTMGLLISAQFDTGHYRRILLTDPQGKVLVERVGPGLVGQAPAWFVGVLPIVSAPGVAQVSDGWKPIGRLEVVSHTAYAYATLWQGALRAAGWMALVGLLAGLAGAAGVRALRRPLAAMVDQTAALKEGRFVSVPVPRAPELGALATAMNATVERLRGVFEAQAAQVEELRRQAERDAGTGLYVRRQFLARLDAAMNGLRGQGGGLVLLRLADLEGLNRRVGRLAADQALQAVAQALSDAGARQPGSLAGRMNGADFALFLPLAGRSAEAGQELATALRHAMPALPGEPVVYLGSTELEGLSQVGDALAAVDDALAQAEADRPYAAIHRQPDPRAVPRSQAQWQALIEACLADDRTSLGQVPVVDRQGGLSHLECPLRLKVDGAAADAEATPTWLSHALRARLGHRVDLRALDLALAAVRADGRARGVSVSIDSLSTPGFVADMRARLLASGSEVARAIWLELPERALEHGADLVADAARQWGEAGARVGLEHAGGQLTALGRIYEWGLAFVKVDRRHVEGVATSPQVRQFASSLVTLLRGLGVQVFAEGVRDPADLAALWEIGFDGAAGPAAALR